MRNQWTILLAYLLCFQFANSQVVTTHQYRRVEPENMKEYLKRETTYWSVLAKNEIKKGNLTYWAILTKVGGEDKLDSPNILIINSFKDMNTAGNIWGGITDLFPNIKNEEIETASLCAVTDHIFLRNINWLQAKNVKPEQDFKYVHIIYHHTKNVGKHFKFENDTWAPLLRKAMDQNITTMKGWGNHIVVSPESIKFPYTSASYDYYSSLHDALSETFSDYMEFPEGFFDDLNENYAGPRSSHLYKIVQVVAAPKEMEDEEN